jgi:DNA-binding LacI/PurR family transcriptional regulator
MELPHYLMGTWAVQHLVEMLSEKQQAQPVQYKIECRLIERASV